MESRRRRFSDMNQWTPTRPSAESASDRAIRYRIRALETRLAALEAKNEAVRQRLLQRASDLEAIAQMYDVKRRDRSG
jgi:hypothetical protein